MSTKIPIADNRLNFDKIWLYIARDSLNATDHVVDLIEAGCRILVQNPLLGRSRPELGPNLRCFPIGNYVIFYSPIQGGTEITRFIIGDRDVDILF